MTHEKLGRIRRFYNEVYYAQTEPTLQVSRHLRKLSRRTGVRPGLEILDVACGTGAWLRACHEQGGHVAGIDLSDKAIEVCKQSLPDGEFHATEAESLPFKDNRFDLVTCLGSLEHFVDPLQALNEMRRVAKADATIIILVPNADFLTRKLGLFRGTYQVDAREEVLTLKAWQDLFESAGLEVAERWKDLHVLSWSWIRLGGWLRVPARTAQALALACWPLKWQYQVYHRLRPRAD